VNYNNWLALSGFLNDLWKYDLSTNEWTWISGSSTPDQLAVYGQIGVPHPNNVPGSKYAGCMWEADNGALWIFGGYGRSPNGNTGIHSHFH
jgi:hypothetical protein